MAFRVGGLEGINKAIECKNTATCEYSSGLQVTGRLHRSPDRREQACRSISARTGPTALAFGTRNCPATAAIITRKVSVRPSARWKETEISAKDEDGCRLGIRKRRHSSRAGSRKSCATTANYCLITFSNCTAKPGRRSRPVRSGLGHIRHGGRRTHPLRLQRRRRQGRLQPSRARPERAHDQESRPTRNAKSSRTFTQQVRDIRERKVGYERLGEIWETQQAEHPDDWLLSMEIFEILDDIEEQPELKRKGQAFLETKKASTRTSRRSSDGASGSSRITGRASTPRLSRKAFSRALKATQAAIAVR